MIDDKDLEDAIMESYRVHFADKDVPVDRVLCDPEERGHFVARVHASLGLPDEMQILQKLVTMRKKSRLPLLISVRRSQEERAATPNFITPREADSPSPPPQGEED